MREIFRRLFEPFVKAYKRLAAARARAARRKAYTIDQEKLAASWREADAQQRSYDRPRSDRWGNWY